MHVTILTGGSRGDVQPLVALAVGLREAGHVVRFCTHPLFEELVSAHGLDFFSIHGNDPRKVVAHEQGANPGGSRLKSIIRIFRRGTPDEHALRAMWDACRDTDLVIFHPIAGAAYHVAEKLGVPCVVANLYPMAATRSFPSPLASPRLRLGATYNRLTHLIVQQLFWMSTMRWVNRWRTEVLHLPALPLTWPYRRLRESSVLQLFGFSPLVIQRPADWDERLQITGYWFLKNLPPWEPPDGLAEFLNSVEPPVCVCFGSVIDSREEELKNVVLKALSLAGKRAVVVEGWGGAFPEHEDLFRVESAPFDWLFPRVSVIVHHGGSGTVAEAVRAGVPSVTVPFFGEQKFWGARLSEIGAAPPPIARNRLTAEGLAEAISVAAGDTSVRERAVALGRRVRAEDGVTRAVEVIAQHCAPGARHDYART